MTASAGRLEGIGESSVTAVVFYNWMVKSGLPETSIPTHPDQFLVVMKEIFGTGAQGLEALITREGLFKRLT